MQHHTSSLGALSGISDSLQLLNFHVSHDKASFHPISLQYPRASGTTLSKSLHGSGYSAPPICKS
eukprot:4967607-Amphidinium_carterae.2